MRIMMLVVIVTITGLMGGCQGFAGRIPCESGRIITDAAAFLFCINKEIDDEKTISESKRAEAYVSTDVRQEPSTEF